MPRPTSTWRPIVIGLGRGAGLHVLCQRGGVHNNTGERWPHHDHDLVFCTELGKPIGPNNFTRRFRQLVATAGLPAIRFHDLRHTHATALLGKGVHAKIASERLGHSTIGITLDTYSHVLPTMQQQAAERIEEALFGS